MVSHARFALYVRGIVSIIELCPGATQGLGRPDSRHPFPASVAAEECTEGFQGFFGGGGLGGGGYCVLTTSRVTRNEPLRLWPHDLANSSDGASYWETSSRSLRVLPRGHRSPETSAPRCQSRDCSRSVHSRSVSCSSHRANRKHHEPSIHTG